jgi:hypothetical protein
MTHPNALSLRGVLYSRYSDSRKKACSGVLYAQRNQVNRA